MTDDIPVHVLGGNIVPLATPPAGAPFNTTSDARGAPLTLLVALPGPPGPPAQQRCGDACGAGAAACGSMYLDAGEELEVGTARDNFLNLTASLVRLLYIPRTDGSLNLNTIQTLRIHVPGAGGRHPARQLPKLNRVPGAPFALPTHQWVPDAADRLAVSFLQTMRLAICVTAAPPSPLP